MTLYRRRFCFSLAGLAGAALLGSTGLARAQPVGSASEAEADRLAALINANRVDLPNGLPARALDLDWFDTVRKRPVPVRLYLPLTTSAPAPLVVFSHGIGGSRRGYSYLGRHFASQGIASLHLQHVGSDRTLWAGNVFSLVGRLQDAAQASEALARVQDLSFALDSLLAQPVLAPLIDAQRIVAAGHSYGANTTLLAAGAQVPQEHARLPLRDARVKAAIAISAPPFYGAADLRGILGGIAVPSLHITATEDVIRIPGYYSGAEDRLAVFQATSATLAQPVPKWLAVFEGGSHSIFTDRGGTGGSSLNPQVKAATQALTLAFVRTVFEGDRQAMQSWPQQHASILARFAAEPA